VTKTWGRGRTDRKSLFGCRGRLPVNSLLRQNFHAGFVEKFRKVKFHAGETAGPAGRRCETLWRTLPLPSTEAGPLIRAQEALGLGPSIGQRPARHAGRVCLKGDAAMEFSGRHAGGGGRITFENLVGRFLCRHRPRLMVCSAAALRLPEMLLAARTSKQVGGAISGKGTLAQAQLFTGLASIDLAPAVKLKKMADKRRGMALMELTMFFQT